MQQMWIIIYPIRMRRKFYRYYFEIYFRLTFIVEKNFISCLPLNISSILETELIERKSELKPPLMLVIQFRLLIIIRYSLQLISEIIIFNMNMYISNILWHTLLKIYKNCICNLKIVKENLYLITIRMLT